MSIETDGFTVLPGLIRQDQCRTAREKLDAIYAAGLAQGQYVAKPSTTANLQNLHIKDPWFISLLGLPRLESMLIPLLNDPNYLRIPKNEPNYILGEYIGRSSGAGGLNIHVDAFSPSIDHLPPSVTVVIAVEDRGADEGCTKVVPGSHRSGQFPEGKVAAIPVPLKAGDAIVWDARLWHGSCPRTSKGLAWGMLMTFQRWWIKQAYDMPALLPAEIKETLTPKQLALLGFCSTSSLTDTGAMMRGYDSLWGDEEYDTKYD